jgi:checkpoint serine/threonine-protein kinase
MPPVIPVVSMVAIEQEKENIQPTSSGRSASHLVALSTQSRSTLLTTLAAAHTRFLAQLAAVAHYDQHSEWEEGRDGLSSEEVATMAEDPLDPHHQYVRYINANYPAGPSAQNRLIPLLEASTRAFVKDERYRNDPRYLRLWNLYAKMVEGEEDVYRYLWARGVGERLALFYEEYAYVLEAAGK